MQSSTKIKILVATSIAGTFITTVVAMDKADKISNRYEIYNAEKNYGDPKEAKRRFVRGCARDILPVVISELVTAGSIIALGNTAIKSNAILAGGLFVAVEQLAALRHAGGEQIDNFILDGYDFTHIKPKHDEIVIFEPYTEQVIITTKKKFEKADARANKRIQNDYTVRLSSVIHDLGGDAQDFGYYIGWDVSNDRQMKQWKKDKSVYISLILSEPRKIQGKEIYTLEYGITPEWLIS